MNYRHAFHAGNHTEVFKHGVLILLLEHFLKKPQPFMILDTHAGIGIYDLEAQEAERTLEKRDGIERVFCRNIAALATYQAMVQSVNVDQPDGRPRYYPGSPEIIRRMLRPGDTLFACERHPADFEILRARYARTRSVRVENRDGYEAVKALLPPAARRGLVFIDPPFEGRDEAARMITALGDGMRRFANGVFCLWYPVKDTTIGDMLAKAVVQAAYPKALRLECLPYEVDGERLAGSGIILVNQPFQFQDKAKALVRDILPHLGDGKGHFSLDVLTSEKP